MVVVDSFIIILVFVLLSLLLLSFLSLSLSSRLLLSLSTLALLFYQIFRCSITFPIVFSHSPLIFVIPSCIAIDYFLFLIITMNVFVLAHASREYPCLVPTFSTRMRRRCNYVIVVGSLSSLVDNRWIFSVLAFRETITVHRQECFNNLSDFLNVISANECFWVLCLVVS